MIIGLAPMDGYTDCAFRQIVKEIFEKYGEKNHELFLWTEFMNADGYVINPPGVIKHLLTDKSQKNVIAQIFGSDEKMLIECFKDIEKKYYHHGKLKIDLSSKEGNGKFSFTGIELNMGCPARNIMNTGGGSALLKDRKKTLELIKKLRKTVKMPFSIKTRIGIDEKDIKKQMEFLIEVSDYVDMISIHGRTTKQVYSGDADRKFIYELKKQVAGRKSQVTKKKSAPGNLLPETSCKIIGNGGIKSYSDIEKYHGILDGVMIGQAAIGNPRIFTPHTPDRKEIKETILRHLDYMIAYEQFFQEEKKNFKSVLKMPSIPKMKKKEIPEMVIVEFRKHLFQYLKGIPGSKDLKQILSTIKEYKPLLEAIQKFFT